MIYFILFIYSNYKIFSMWAALNSVFMNMHLSHTEPETWPGVWLGHWRKRIVEEEKQKKQMWEEKGQTISPECFRESNARRARQLLKHDPAPYGHLQEISQSAKCQPIQHSEDVLLFSLLTCYVLRRKKWTTKNSTPKNQKTWTKTKIRSNSTQIIRIPAKLQEFSIWLQCRTYICSR